MKKENGFLTGLEKYLISSIGRTPLPEYWTWVAAGLIVIMLITSFLSRNQAVVDASSMSEMIERAAKAGDYELARRLYGEYRVSGIEYRVLGEMSELDDLVYPEKVVEREISRLVSGLETYPGNREVYLALARLYEQVEMAELASEYREKARILDPNAQ